MSGVVELRMLRSLDYNIERPTLLPPHKRRYVGILSAVTNYCYGGYSNLVWILRKSISPNESLISYINKEYLRKV